MIEKNQIVVERGMIEINNSNVKCFLGKGENIKSSEEIMKELNNDINNDAKKYTTYFLGDQSFFIIFPISPKNISIISSEGKRYKSIIYFTDDIKNIILCF